MKINPLQILVLIAAIFLYGCASFPWQSNRFNERRYSPSDEIYVGMPMSEVLSAWGDPSNVQNAGAATQGNQRWTYSPSVNGLTANRILYFEEGRVAGWETQETPFY